MINKIRYVVKAKSFKHGDKVLITKIYGLKEVCPEERVFLKGFVGTIGTVVIDTKYGKKPDECLVKMFNGEMYTIKARGLRRYYS